MFGSGEKNHTFITIIKFGLLIFTAARSLDLLWWTFDGLGTLQIISVLGILGLDIALLAWDDYTASKYETLQQRSIGLWMIVINAVAIGAAVVADTARVIAPTEMKNLIYYVALFGLPAIILLNVGALIAIHQTDPDAILAQEQRQRLRKKQIEDAKHKAAMEDARNTHERDIETLHQRAQIAGASAAARQALSQQYGVPVEQLQPPAPQAPETNPKAGSSGQTEIPAQAVEFPIKRFVIPPPSEWGKIAAGAIERANAAMRKEIPLEKTNTGQEAQLPGEVVAPVEELWRKAMNGDQGAVAELDKYFDEGDAAWRAQKERQPYKEPTREQMTADIQGWHPDGSSYTVLDKQSPYYGQEFIGSLDGNWMRGRIGGQDVSFHVENIGRTASGAAFDARREVHDKAAEEAERKSAAETQRIVAERQKQEAHDREMAALMSGPIVRAAITYPGAYDGTLELIDTNPDGTVNNIQEISPGETFTINSHLTIQGHPTIGSGTYILHNDGAISLVPNSPKG